uniref:Uncharacterized protein n=1 Tax=Populus alba TaxID=43335 RepID=A0A4U5PVW8_POPAL|nr:hypothetical protein D5086_0000171730 [Populus alba]
MYTTSGLLKRLLLKPSPEGSQVSQAFKGVRLLCVTITYPIITKQKWEYAKLERECLLDMTAICSFRFPRRRSALWGEEDGGAAAAFGGGVGDGAEGDDEDCWRQ